MYDNNNVTQFLLTAGIGWTNNVLITSLPSS